MSTAAVQRRERGTEGRGTRDARYDAHLSCPSRYAHHWLKALTSPTCIMRRATTFRRERASSRLSQQFQARNSLSLRNLAPNRASRAWSFLAVRGGEAGRGGAWRRREQARQAAARPAEKKGESEVEPLPDACGA